MQNQDGTAFHPDYLELRSVVTLLGSGHQNLHETYQCRMYSRELMMMGKEDAQNR
jgi:hypothetical protein